MNFSEELKTRTKKFALRIINLYRNSPKIGEAKVIGNQILRSGTSVGENYRAATRARSNKEFFSKISIVLEEADETLFWLELINDANILDLNKIQDLMIETEEIVKIMSSTRHKMRSKL